MENQKIYLAPLAELLKVKFEDKFLASTESLSRVTGTWDSADDDE